MEKEVKCFRCNSEQEIMLEVMNKSSVRSYCVKEGTQVVPVTFINKDKVEVEYYCNYCKNKNKIIVDLK